MATPRALVSLLLVASLPAQEPPRVGIAGEVKGRDGKAFAGATVTLLHAAHPSLVDEHYVDRISATTDEHGRFRAELLHGMAYVAWANGAVVDGTFVCSPVARDVVAGVPVSLAVTERRGTCRVRPRIDAGWNGELRFAASARIGPYLVQHDLALADGVLVPPPLPTPAVLHARHGEFTVFSCELTAGQTAAAGELRDITIGAPVVYPVRVVDQRDRPIAGVLLSSVALSLADDDRRLRFARSDDDGILHVRLARGQDPPLMMRLTGAAIPEHVATWDFAAAKAGAAHVVKLGQGEAIAGRVHLRADEPAAAMPLLLDCLALIPSHPDGFFASGTRVVTTGHDGTFAFHASEPDPSRAFWFAAVLSPAQRARLCRSATEPPLAASALLLPPTSAAAHDLRIDALDTVDVKVVDASGGAPGPVHVVVLPMRRFRTETDHLPTFPLRAWTDRTGRMRFLAPKGTELALVAFSKTGAAWVQTTVDGRAKDLRLDPRHVLPIRVTDEAGQPVAGVRVHPVFGKSPHLSETGERVRHFVDALRQDAPWVEWQTGADGCADLVVPLLDCSLELQFAREFEDLGWFRGAPAERMQLVVKKRR